MPRKANNSKSASQSGGNGFPTAINCNLSDEQKSFCKANILGVTELLSRMEDLLADNYKITLSYDDTTDCYAVYLIGKDNQVANPGMMLSAYAPVLTGCLTVLLYKHVNVLHEDWSGHSQANNSNSWR